MIDQSISRVSSQYRESSKSWPSWLSFTSGGLLTLGLFYFGIARPASEEMTVLRKQVDALQSSIATLAGHKGAVDETNHLLSLLGQQHAFASTARKTLNEIQKLNNDLIAESKKVDEALLAVDRLASIKDLALANSKHMFEAVEALEASEALQNRLADSADSAELALRATIDLLAIRGELVQNAYLNESAGESLEQLIDIRNQIDSTSTNLDDARESIAGLVALKNSVLDGSHDLKDSIETLDTTREMQHQFAEAASSFKEMRMWMLEMAALQPIFNRVQTAIQPLTDLAKLEKMQPQQLREFAKLFSKQIHTARLASVPSPTPSFPDAPGSTLESNVPAIE